MVGQVLWIIDNELDGARFERLCVDLLHRNGYREIVPIEPQDGGRDAEEFPRQGRGRDGCAAFFQFSLEQDWKRKLRRDARKLANRRAEFSILVFVTSRSARGVDVDSLKTHFRKEYGWTLIVYSREWLRLQLEEVHPDLAKRHLGIDFPPSLSRPSWLIRTSEPKNDRLSDAWAMLADGAYQGASAALIAFLEDKPESAIAWQALAWSNYCLHRFDQALSEINRALKLKDDSQALSIRACILVEKGIIDSNKTAVLEALRLFERLLASMNVPDWHILFNLGNALSALGRHQDSIARYKQALELDDSRPEIWKNLASSYHFVGNHQEEMKCFDKALELDPLKAEALVSKGVSMMIDFGKPEEAAPLLEMALRSKPDFATSWPPIWYWLGLAYKQCGSLRKALARVQDGLDHQPGDRGLRRLKSALLESIAAQSDDLTEEARRFWRTEISDQPFDYKARSRLALLETKKGGASAAWSLLDECFSLVKMDPAPSLATSRFDLRESIAALKFLPQYAAYRKVYPVSDYWNSEDPLYDLSFAPPCPDRIAEALGTFFSIPFGLGLHYLEEHSVARGSKRNLVEFFDALRIAMERAVIESSRELASLIPQTHREVEAVVSKLIEIAMFLGLVALREFGRQRGWIASQFRIPHSSLTGALHGYDEVQIERNVVSRSIIRINKEANIFTS